MSLPRIGRREVLAIMAAAIGAKPGRVRAESLPPARAITRGPKHHWFGYYDKLEFDPSSRYVLGMEVDFEHRTPAADDTIALGMVDLDDGDRWIGLGETRAWCWQQGCMLQWLPGSKTQMIWNDRDGDHLVARVLDVGTRVLRSLPAPIYAVSPDARWAIAPDFRRLHDTRPGYGYAGIPDPNSDVRAPEDAGIWSMDLATGRTKLLLSFAEVARIPYLKKGEADGAKHWFNHLLVSPDGTRFAFLHRWQARGAPRFTTRLITANPDGTELSVLDPHGKTSHFIWRDPRHIFAWAFHPSHGSGFYLFEDRTGSVVRSGPGMKPQDGHCTYLPKNRWILCDTYPDPMRLQHPYLYNIMTDTPYPLGHFRSPPEYTGEWRCDTHPRFSPDGRKVVIDSPHGGNGRQLYLIDISKIVES